MNRRDFVCFHIYNKSFKLLCYHHTRKKLQMNISKYKNLFAVLFFKYINHIFFLQGDLILEVPYLIEAITKIISITNKREMLNINSTEDGT